MNKTEFIARVASETGTTKVDAKDQVNNVLNTIMSVMNDGEEVNLSGFGKFYVKDVEAAVKRNPATGENVDVPAHRAPKFKFANTVKEFVR